MKVRLHNDGKETAQSFEVHAETDFRWPDSNGVAAIEAYGPTAEAAQKRALEAIDQLRAELAELATHRLLKIV